jgi:uncharacterized membrane protein YbhN (UPF0104 family)
MLVVAFGLAVLFAVSALRLGSRFSARLFGALAAAPEGMLGQMAEALERAGRAPAGVMAGLVGLSAARLVVVTLRAVAVALVFVPEVSPVLVAAAYPAAGLVQALPFTPAGLGLAEWSWTGLLVLAGAMAPAAAMAALAFRAVNVIALTLLSGAVVGLGLVRDHVLTSDRRS